MEFLKKSIPTLFGAALTGALLFFSFPKYGTGWVAWIALLPLFYSLRGKRLGESFLLGLMAGFICHVGVMYWITFVVVQYGYLPVYMGIAAMLLVAAYLSLYTGLFALGVRFFMQRPLPLILTAPVVWVSLEYVKSQILTGFPWENLGYSQYHNLALIQVSDLTGVYGISFLIVFVNALLHEITLAAVPGRTKFLKAAVGVLVVGTVIAYGFFRMGGVAGEMEQIPRQEVSLIQGNVDQNVKWNPEFQQQTMADYISLTMQAAPTGRRLIVWPETAVPFFFQDRNEYRRVITDLVRRTDSWLLFGSPSYVEERGTTTLFNSAYLLSPQGDQEAKYDKVHLVPYGEYVPLRRLFPFISKLVQGIGDFGTGKGYVPLAMDGRQIGILICYEGIFAEAGRIYRRNGAELLVNITNDAWFGRTSAPYQHLSMTVFRAVENRLYLIRAANTGISAIIDPLGRIVSRTRLFEKATLRGEMRFMGGGTFYSAWGDMFVFACGILLVIFIIMAMKGRKRP